MDQDMNPIFTKTTNDTSSPRCRESGGCFDRNNPTTYQNTYPLLTSFYRPLNMVEGACYTTLPKSNYSPYDLFCLKTKLQTELYWMDPLLSIGFSKKELHDVMQLTIDIY